jgi:CheY-like chemotaxis protein
MGESEVLLVDDDPGILSLLCDYLREKGFRTTCAPSAEEAFRQLNERARSGGPAFAAVVSDWMMPGMDGVALLNQIRSGEFQELPFVLMSGAVSKDVLLKAVKYDPDAVLLKPFSINALCVKIQEAIKVRERKQIERARIGDKTP